MHLWVTFYRRQQNGKKNMKCVLEKKTEKKYGWSRHHRLKKMCGTDNRYQEKKDDTKLVLL